MFVAFHHPPVELHQPAIDAIRLQPAEPLADMLAAHPQVVAVLTGHAHTAAASTYAGRPLLVAPGVISTLRLELMARWFAFSNDRQRGRARSWLATEGYMPTRP